MCGSGAVSCSCSLLIRGPILPAVRQKLHLSPCADSRSRLSSCTRLAGIPLATLYSLQKLVLRGVERYLVQCARRLGDYPSRTLPRPSNRTSQRTLVRIERVLLDREHALLRLHGILSHLHGCAQPPM